ncbi:hypothetical protein DUI87_12851 [Hirundo rustica rustica]|uniref:Uncharacterized protein n=1 Tax=Hirundo rustica rustica TaxID=333673 RepID=A0A3M0KA41_HIRRU|nr:hypothetical protein DUI87_12851 [Hirundo rustica rustica]
MKAMLPSQMTPVSCKQKKERSDDVYFTEDRSNVADLAHGEVLFDRVGADRKILGLVFAAEDGDAGLGVEDLRTRGRHGLWAEELECEFWIELLEEESSSTKLRLWNDVGTMRQEK